MPSTNSEAHGWCIEMHTPLSVLSGYIENEAALAEIDRQLAEINALEEAVDEANT